MQTAPLLRKPNVLLAVLIIAVKPEILVQLALNVSPKLGAAIRKKIAIGSTRNYVKMAVQMGIASMLPKVI